MFPFMHRILFLIAIVSFTSCQEIIDAPVPNLAWTEFDAPGLQPLSATERKAIEGVYTIGQSAR